MSDDEGQNDSGKSEAQIRMEEARKRNKERAEEEWREYEELRKEQREKEVEEIQELRERRERRRKEREEEEKRLVSVRSEEEAKRRADEEERGRKKREEEQRKKEEREKKRAEFEARSKANNRPNFVITKKPGGEQQEEEVKKEEVTKSKEQLEAEKRAILEQRIPPLSIAGFKADQLRAKAKELNELIYRLEGDKYDLEQRFARQSYEMQELAERARQMNKGSGKTKTIQNAPDPLAAKISGIPPKVNMYSEYERVKDHRTFGDRKTVFAGPLYRDEYVRIDPQQKVVMTEAGFKVEDGEGGGSHNDGHSAPPPKDEIEVEE